MRKANILLMVCFISFLISCTDGHVHAWTSNIEKAPTCTEQGILVRKCPCGTVERLPLDAKGHSEAVEKMVIEPDCVSEGKMDSVCMDCGHVFESRAIPALGHSPMEETTIKAPTCTEPGKKSVICSRCNISLGDMDIPATGHGSDLRKIRVKEPDCENSGMDSLQCTVCNQEVSTEEVPPLGHLWEDEYKVITESTCSLHGSGLQKCERDGNHSRIVELPLIPHTFTGEAYIKKVSTCTEHGIIATCCTVCGYENESPLELKPHIMNWQWKRDSLGNPMVPTETEPGWKVWTCDSCGYFYEEQVSIEDL